MFVCCVLQVEDGTLDDRDAGVAVVDVVVLKRVGIVHTVSKQRGNRGAVYGRSMRCEREIQSRLVVLTRMGENAVEAGGQGDEEMLRQGWAGPLKKEAGPESASSKSIRTVQIEFDDGVKEGSREG
jgi:hypothetical protein